MYHSQTAEQGSAILILHTAGLSQILTTHSLKPELDQTITGLLTVKLCQKLSQKAHGQIYLQVK